MAEVQLEARRVGLNFVVCGPPQAGKSTILATIRTALRATAEGERSWRGAGLELGGPIALEVVPVLHEIDAIDGEKTAATPKLAAADAILFVADSRRERLRDDVVAWAWLLERLREAKRDDVPVVVAMHRRDAPHALPPADLDAALCAGRHPVFETEGGDARTTCACLVELVRRAAARSYVTVEALWPEWDRGPFVSALDAKLGECMTRALNPEPPPPAPASVAPAATAVVVAAPVTAASSAVTPIVATPVPVPPVAAEPPARTRRARRTRRAPLLRCATHFFQDFGRTTRERRRLTEQLACVVEDSRRPMAFLTSLFAHLEREAPKLSSALEEAVAGGAEILKHLEAVLSAASRGVERRASDRKRERPCDLEHVARSAFAALRRDVTLPRARLRFSHLPTVNADPDGIHMLMWAALGAVLRAARRRERRLPVVRVSVRERTRGLRLRIAWLEGARRGSGIEEILLARRLAARLGIGFCIVASRRGGKALLFDLPPAMCVVEPSGSAATVRVEGATVS